MNRYEIDKLKNIFSQLAEIITSAQLEIDLRESKMKIVGGTRHKKIELCPQKKMM